jgi:protein-disulfide isomerase
MTETTSARVGAFIFGGVGHLLSTAFDKLSLRSRWRPAAHYGQGNVATLGSGAFQVTAAHAAGNGPFAEVFIGPLASFAPAEELPNASIPKFVRHTASASEQQGEGALAVVVSRGSFIHVLGEHASRRAAMRHFRRVVAEMGHELLGPVKGAPWEALRRPPSLTSRIVKGAAVAVVAFLVLAPIYGALHGRAAAYGQAGYNQSSPLAGVPSKMIPIDLNLSHSWEQLTADQQQTLLRVAAGQSPIDGGTSAAAVPKAASAQGQMLDAEHMALVRQAASIAAQPGKKGAPAVIVFEDPLCSACRQLAGEKFGADIPVAVVPIAFQQGAPEWASKALCSPDAGKAWLGLMAGSMPQAKAACAAGDATIAKNNDLFRSLGFVSTPVLVAPNGRVMVGAPDATTFNAWYEANLQ